MLLRDDPVCDLRSGDLGTVSLVYYASKVAEVEFIRGRGETHALVMLEIGKLRKMSPSDIACVRKAAKSSKRFPLCLDLRERSDKHSRERHGSKIKKRRHT